MLLAAIVMVSLAGARGMVPLSLKLMTPNVKPTRSNPVFARVNVNMSYAPAATPSLAMYYTLRKQQTAPDILDGVLNQVVQELEDKSANIKRELTRECELLTRQCEVLTGQCELLIENKGLLEEKLNSAAESTPAALTLHHSAPCPRSPTPCAHRCHAAEMRDRSHSMRHGHTLPRRALCEGVL